MLRIDEEPKLRDPVLLCGFSGWADAGFAASSAVRFVARKYGGHVIAEFDPDEVFSYTVTRPVTALVGPGQRSLRWPRLAWTVVRLPDERHDMLILRGPEPDLRWRACVDAVIQFASRLGVKQVLALAAFHAGVPHNGPPFLIGQSANPALRVRLTMLGLRESGYEGPAGFVTTIVDAAQKAAIPSAAIWAAVPSYLSGTNNPKLAAALLGAVEQLIGQSVQREELEAAGRHMEKQVDEALRNRPDLANSIRRITGAPKAPREGGPAAREDTPPGRTAEGDELPSAEEVVRNVEEHLRRMRREPPSDAR